MNETNAFKLSALLLSQLFYAQEIKGLIIINEQSKAPISSISVNNADNSFHETSDNNGFINLSQLKNQNEPLYINGIGYENDEILISELKKERNMAYVYIIPTSTSIEQISFTGKAYRNNIFQPISDLDIKLRPINSSQDILRSVPGLFIGQHAGGGKAEQLFIRGFDVDHGTDVRVTADGVPVNMVSHAHGQGYTDLHYIIPEFIDKVSFSKGSYLADKGNFATAGSVNFRTKSVLGQNFFKGEIGQFKTYRGVLGLNLLERRDEKHHLYFGAEANFTDGYFDHPQDFSRYNGVLKYHGQVTDNSHLTATLSGFTSKWYASGQIPLLEVNAGRLGWFGAIDPTEGGQTSRYNANFELTSYLNNGAKLKNQTYFSHYLFELYSNFTFFKEEEKFGDEIRQKERRNLYGYNTSYEKTFSLGNIKTETLLGAQFRYDDIPHIELTRTIKRVTYKPLKEGAIQELNLGLFWSQKLSISPNFDITPSVRYDYFHNFYENKMPELETGLNPEDPKISEDSSYIYDRLFPNKGEYKAHTGIFSPKINFNWTVNDKIQIYSYWGKGFHSNDSRVATYTNGKKVVTPAYGTDLGGIFKIGKNFILQMAGFYLWLDQEFIYVGDEAVVEAGGKTQRIGVDLSARLELVKNLFVDFNFNYTHARAKTTFDENDNEISAIKGQNYLGLAPAILSTGGLTYRKNYGWNGSLKYRWMGDRPANDSYSRTVKGYFVTDATVNYTTKRWEAGVSIQNLFNTKWGETQFDTEYRLKNDPPGKTTTNIAFTPGTPFFAKAQFTLFF